MSYKKTERELNKISKTTNKQNEKFNRYRNHKIEPKRYSELKNMKSINRRLDQTEERIYELKNRSFEIIWLEEDRKNERRVKKDFVSKENLK